MTRYLQPEDVRPLAIDRLREKTLVRVVDGFEEGEDAISELLVFRALLTREAFDIGLRESGLRESRVIEVEAQDFRIERVQVAVGEGPVGHPPRNEQRNTSADNRFNDV